MAHPTACGDMWSMCPVIDIIDPGISATKALQIIQSMAVVPPSDRASFVGSSVIADLLLATQELVFRFVVR